jgi:hypothetical protein
VYSSNIAAFEDTVVFRCSQETAPPRLDGVSIYQPEDHRLLISGSLSGEGSADDFATTGIVLEKIKDDLSSLLGGKWDVSVEQSGIGQGALHNLILTVPREKWAEQDMGLDAG